jgi:hypothetical protein
MFRRWEGVGVVDEVNDDGDGDVDGNVDVVRGGEVVVIIPSTTLSCSCLTSTSGGGVLLR